MRVPAVERRIEQIRADGERLIKEVEHLYDMEILRLPPEIREMNWVEYFGTGRAVPGGQGRVFPGVRNPRVVQEQPGAPLSGISWAVRKCRSLCLRPLTRCREN